MPFFHTGAVYSYFWDQQLLLYLLSHLSKFYFLAGIPTTRLQVLTAEEEVVSQNSVENAEVTGRGQIAIAK